jgi:hypothetical protein
MCVLCGDLMTQLHWTDATRREGEGDTVEVGGARQRDNARSRWQRLRLVDDVLQFYGLRAQDWQGTRYVIADRKGRSELGANLEEVWRAADTLAGRAIDPLDPELLQHLLGSSRDSEG